MYLFFQLLHRMTFLLMFIQSTFELHARFARYHRQQRIYVAFNQLYEGISQQDVMQTLHSDMPWCFQPLDTACVWTPLKLEQRAQRFQTCNRKSNPNRRHSFQLALISLMLYCHQYRSVKPWCPFLHKSGSARIMRCPIINRLQIMRKSHTHRRIESSWLIDKHIKSETHISLWKGNAPTASVCSLSVSLSQAQLVWATVGPEGWEKSPS